MIPSKVMISFAIQFTLLMRFFLINTEETKFENAFAPVEAQVTITENLFDKVSFDDPFSSETPKKSTNGNDGNNNFDPFGTPVASAKKVTETKAFDFDDNFANFDSYNNNGSTNGNGKTFDAWGESLDTKNNNTSTGKVKKQKDAAFSKISKADYSDNFDNDIEEVLKRSVKET